MEITIRKQTLIRYREIVIIFWEKYTVFSYIIFNQLLQYLNNTLTFAWYIHYISFNSSIDILNVRQGHKTNQNFFSCNTHKNVNRFKDCVTRQPCFQRLVSSPLLLHQQFLDYAVSLALLIRHHITGFMEATQLTQIRRYFAITPVA